MKRMLVILSAALLLHGAMAADPLPFQGAPVKSGAAYRGNLLRNGVFERTGITAVKGLRWKTELGGKINASPVVWGDTLFIGGPQGFHALDAATGAERWRFPTKVQVDSSACVADGIVCFTTTEGRLLALDATTGKQKWQYRGTATPTSRSAPAIVYGAVLCPLGKETVAVRLDNGKRLWSIDKYVPDEYSALACAPDGFYSLGHLTWGLLIRYDYTTAQPVWRGSGNYSAGVYLTKPLAIDADGFVYFNTTRGAGKFSPVAQGRVPAGHNERIWGIFLLDKQIDDNEMIPQAAPTVWQGRLYAGRYDGKLVALDTKDGKELWRKQYPAPVLSDPSVAAKSGLLVFGCHDGLLRAVDAATGEDRWSFPTGGTIFASPWIGDGVVYVASHDGYVYALE